MNSLLVPAKCSSTCASAVISIPSTDGLVTSQVSVRIHRHDVNQRENKHPDEVDEVPVQSADLYIFMFQFVDTRCDYQQVDRARRYVKHVQPSDREERCAKQRRRWRTVSRRKHFCPMFGQVEGPQTFVKQVSPLD